MVHLASRQIISLDAKLCLAQPFLIVKIPKIVSKRDQELGDKCVAAVKEEFYACIADCDSQLCNADCAGEYTSKIVVEKQTVILMFSEYPKMPVLGRPPRRVWKQQPSNLHVQAGFKTRAKKAVATNFSAVDPQ